MEPITYQPIGKMVCENDRPYGAPRQSVLASGSRGVVKLKPPITKDCLEDLKGFDRIWLIYDFHHNTNWKQKVQPPRVSSVKRSVLATRSPYRPNSIGMSCVKLEKIEGLNLYISDHDLLDGTPILDIKPYLAYADSFPDAQTGWIEDEPKYEIEFEAEALVKLRWLQEHVSLPLFDVIKTQLEYAPTCRRAKRVKAKGENFVFSLETWRFPFAVLGSKVRVFDVYSGYSEREMSQGQDPYGDKMLHHVFCDRYTVTT